MKPKGYLFFHLNIGFSSIEEEARLAVVQHCYHPLLDLIEKTNIPIGVELSGWTLKQIQKIDSHWVTRFRNLLNSDSCELIGSGYSQIIGPLVPYSVNNWNQILGIDTYQNILNRRPKIILVNEMAFSSNMVDLYHSFGYDGFIMDRDNIKLALNSNSFSAKKIPTHAQGTENTLLPVLWSDSILFQKVQHYAHGDISTNDYLSYIKNRIKRGELVFPIYCNDAEIFDYRPGRFNEERPTHPEGEWNRVEKLLNAITYETDIEFISPSKALRINIKTNDKIVSKLVNLAYPIPVKKQGKYNIARWAITGRDDLWLNTMCHKIEKYLTKSNNKRKKDWRDLCELWTSDLRTHITDKRWVKTKNKVNSLLKKHNINKTGDNKPKINKNFDLLKNIIGQYGKSEIALDEEKIYLTISTKNIKLKLNLRRGLTIESLAFASHDMVSCIGTLPHGYFSSISLGADYYSGGLIIDLPTQRTRITDLEKIDPRFFTTNNGNIEIHSEIRTQFGNIKKILDISVDSEEITLKYSFSSFEKFIGSARLGIITLLNEFSKSSTKLFCCNGGEKFETFNFSGKINHIKPASTIVSSSRGLGATDGKIKIRNHKKNIDLKWDTSSCAAMPMIYNNFYEKKKISRLLFSVKEIDDTVKKKSNIGNFTLTIST